MGMGREPLIQQDSSPQLDGLVAQLQNQVAYQQQLLKQRETIKSVSSLIPVPFQFESGSRSGHVTRYFCARRGPALL